MTKKFSPTLQPIHLPQSTPQDKPRAVIDIGSHSVLLLIAHQATHGTKCLAEDYHITALGEGMSRSKLISQPAAERTCKVVKRFFQRCQTFDVHFPLLVATGALRAAENQAQIVAYLTSQVPLPFHILTEQQEAYFTRVGALSNLDLPPGAITVDLGGRSTEIAGHSIPVSIPIGCQGATEMFFRKDPPHESDIDRLRKTVRSFLSSSLTNHRASDLVFSGGTATTLAMLDKKMDSYQASSVHGHRITSNQLQALVKTLSSRSHSRIAESWKIEPDRASVLLAGAVILEEITLWHGVRKLIISARGLTWGVWLGWDQPGAPTG